MSHDTRTPMNAIIGITSLIRHDAGNKAKVIEYADKIDISSQQMNDRPDGKNIPIIAMTANSFAEDVQASLDAGMKAHLSKPIVIDEVIKTILRYVYN